MCLIAIASGVHPQFPLIVLANRDEHYDRPTDPAAFYPESRGVFAGRDRAAGGTWMGVARHQRFAAITNFRDPVLQNDQRKSRGTLVDDYLKGLTPPHAFIEALRPSRELYNPFNLLLSDSESLLCYSSVTDQLVTMSSGIYGLSNHSLDTPWPKVVRARQILADATSKVSFDPESAILAMQDPQQYEARFLPSTGVDEEMEQALSAIFIQLKHYGTRSTTLMLQDRQGDVSYWEMSYDSDGHPTQMGVVCLSDSDFESAMEMA